MVYRQKGVEMQLKSNKIKSMNDFLMGLLLLAGGLWLMLSDKITEGRILKSQRQGFLQADTYIQVLGGLVVFLAVLMVIRSINFKKEAETQAFSFYMSKESLLTFVALILYVALLKPLGFSITTFLFTFFIACIYMLKETKNKGLSRRDKIKKMIILAVFSVIMVIAVYLIFGKVLLVILP